MEFNQTLNLKPIYPHPHIGLYNAPVISSTMPSLSGLTSGLNIVTAAAAAAATVNNNGPLNNNGSSNNINITNNIINNNNNHSNNNNINSNSTSNSIVSAQALTATPAHHQLVPVNSMNSGLNNVQIQQLQVYSKQPNFSRNQLQMQFNNDGKHVSAATANQIVQIQITNPSQLTSASASLATNEIPTLSAVSFGAGHSVSNNSSNSVPDTISSNQSNGSLSNSLSPDMGLMNNKRSESNNNASAKVPSSSRDNLTGPSGSNYVDLAKASCSSAINVKLNSTDNNNFSINSFKSANGRGFKCQICERDFTQKGNLKTHLMTHSGERPYECQTCGKNFTQKGNLDTHVKIHTETKDHKCQYCDRGFTQRGNLKTHIRSIHTKEKPYACGHCGKSFSQKGNMLTHFRTHDKEARFPCNICGKTFSQKGNLRTHQQRHGRGAD